MNWFLFGRSWGKTALAQTLVRLVLNPPRTTPHQIYRSKTAIYELKWEH